MGYEVKLPAWLERRGYSSTLKARIGRSKAGRLDLVQAEPTIRPHPSSVGKATELQHYLAWRMNQLD